MRAALRFCCVAAAAASAAAQQQPSRVTSSAELRTALRAAKPGAAIVLAPGDYEALAVANVAGTGSARIVVRAEVASTPPRFTGGIHLSDCNNLTLDGLVVDGAPANGINIDDSGTFDTPSQGIVLRNVTVRDVGGAGNHDGIKLSGVSGARVEACTVERWGRGGSAIDMVGCRGVVIEGCTFRDREDGAAATGVQMKGGSRDIEVRRCRFEHAGERAVNLGGSTGLQYFRPRPEGFEAKDVTVEGCTFVGSTAPIAFVGCDGATVRFNTFHLPRKWVLRILQETRSDEFVPCRRGVFADNLIVVRGIDAALNIGSGTAPETFTFARNWWFRADAPERSLPRLPVAETGQKGGADPRFVDAGRGDLRLPVDSPARAHGAGALPGAQPAGK